MELWLDVKEVKKKNIKILKPGQKKDVQGKRNVEERPLVPIF